MKIRRLEIRNFRGIRELAWLPKSGITCLIGEGNSTKTTILDAIALVLSPRFSASVTDADFYDCDLDQKLTIEVYLTDVPDGMVSLDRFGDMTCGITDDGTTTTDPEDGTELCVAVRFSSDRSLEPLWEVFKPDSDLATRISAAARAELGLFRVDDRVDNHMKWIRGSALTALTGGADTASGVVTEAYRSARKAIFDGENPSLSIAAKSVETVAAGFGVSAYNDLRAGLDPGGLSNGFNLVLHDGDVPLTSQGLGARRLTSMAIQHARANERACVLVDEVETGLEPHRLHRLLRKLAEDAQTGSAQIILTTHSSLVVEALPADSLAIVRSQGGVTSITPVPSELAEGESPGVQGMIRQGPSAMLASRILVAEGATELGVLRAFTAHWEQTAPLPLASVGTAVKDGKSDEQALVTARLLVMLGYPTAVLVDSDKPLVEKEQAATDAGANVIRWADGLCLEQRVALDLSEAGLKELVALAAVTKGDDEQAIRNAVSARLPTAFKTPALVGIDPMGWVHGSRTLLEIRRAVGTAAHKGGWFKSESRGETLGNLLIRHLESMNETDFSNKVEDVRVFMFAEGSSDVANP